jgi:outer membrane protein assembly factor BamB
MVIMVISLQQERNNKNVMIKFKSIAIFIILSFCMILGGCYKKQFPPGLLQNDTYPYPTDLEVLWRMPFYPDSTSSYYFNPDFAGQYIVFANESSDAGHYPKIGVYDRFTGKQHLAWEYGHTNIIESNGQLDDCKIGGTNKDIVCVFAENNLYGYNLSTGQQLWKANIPLWGTHRISTSDKYVFASYGPDNKSWSRLLAIDIVSGIQTDILTLYMEDNYEIRINPPSSYITSMRDTLLFFTTSGWNSSTVHGRVYAYCYNLTKKQMVWVNKNFTTDRGASASLQPPLVIENDKLIITSFEAIHCFNINTGEVIWQEENLSLVDRPYVYHQGKLYVRSGDPCILLCYDAQTGQILWQNTTLNPIPAPRGNMGIYKDKLYFTAWGKDAWIGLFCVDANNGELLWQDAGPSGRMSYGVIIDHERGYMYCQSGWLVMCVDLNKTPNGKKDK